MLLKIFATFILLFFCFKIEFAFADSTDFRFEDRIRIRESMKIYNEIGEKVWKNSNDIPFAIILVTNKNEYLINLSNPTDDFKSLGYDSIVTSEVFVRPRQFNNNLLATFPAVNGVSTIVVGLPENTSRSSMDWIVTILHEHFHQLQASKPDHYSDIDALNLRGDDKSGMWMLNYDFPYRDEKVNRQYKILTQSAKKTYLSMDNLDFEINLNDYLDERKKFKELLSKKDYKYFSFQIWQEGFARYSEIKFAEFLIDFYTPSKELMKLNDYISPDSFYTRILNRLLRRADFQDLANEKRDCFYTLGALEGLILDKANPGWKDLYFKEKFFIEKYYK
ncbi:MAG: hypothetical protein M3R36_06950 [Bacteroidota bacterium]|nr:hypothetical protein [Bacteroidota bacterium]